MVQVVLPGNLVTLFPGAARRMEVDATTVRELVAGLEARLPGIADRLLAAGPVLREHIRVFVDGEMATLDTAIAAGSTVVVIPAVSGG